MPLKIGYISKGDGGYKLVVQEHSQSVCAQTLKLRKDVSVEQAIQSIAQNCLAQIHGNERRVVSAHDPSSVHQMRVGLRRLRSAFELFEVLITPPPSLQEELRG